MQHFCVCRLNYHDNNKTSKTLLRLGKAITRYPLLLTGTVGASMPPVVVAGDAPPVGTVVFQFVFTEEPAADSAAVVTVTRRLSEVLNHISYKVAF